MTIGQKIQKNGRPNNYLPNILLIIVVNVIFQTVCKSYNKYNAIMTGNVAYYTTTGLCLVRATRKKKLFWPSDVGPNPDPLSCL